MKQDYSLTGTARQRAEAAGLVRASWYKTPVEPGLMRALMVRRDGPGLVNIGLWLGLMAGSAGLALSVQNSYLSALCFAFYGVLAGSGADSRWHEAGHGTAFRTVWLNRLVYQLASFLMMRNPIVWQRSHDRHHTDTLIVGRDAEIAVMRPPNLLEIGLNFFGLISGVQSLLALARQSTGRLTEDERDFIPRGQWQAAIRAARWHMAIYAATVGAVLYWQSPVPILLIGGPRFYGIWLLSLLGLTQHGGLAEGVLDHRMNTRTVLINPLFGFIYMNMNYHIEHHMYPAVPFFNLPRLHQAIRHDCPPPDPNLLACWKQMIKSWLKQRKDPSYALDRTSWQRRQ